MPTGEEHSAGRTAVKVPPYDMHGPAAAEAASSSAARAKTSARRGLDMTLLLIGKTGSRDGLLPEAHHHLAEDAEAPEVLLAVHLGDPAHADAVGDGGEHAFRAHAEHPGAVLEAEEGVVRGLAAAVLAHVAGDVALLPELRHPGAHAQVGDEGSAFEEPVANGPEDRGDPYVQGKAQLGHGPRRARHEHALAALGEGAGPRRAVEALRDDVPQGSPESPPAGRAVEDGLGRVASAHREIAGLRLHPDAARGGGRRNEDEGEGDEARGGAEGHRSSQLSSGPG